MAIVSQLCISFPYVLHGLCEDYLTCDIAFNAVMPLSRASTCGRYSRIEGITAGAVIDCNKGNVTFHVNGNQHTVHFPKKQPQVHSINSIGKNSTITIGGFEFPLPTVKKKYDILIIGDVHIPIEVTQRYSKFLRFHVI